MESTAPSETKTVHVRSGNLEMRLAQTTDEVAAAQALRYRVFYDEMKAQPTPEMAAQHRDFDHFDAYCDHLLTIDHDRGTGPESVVGTYRLLRREAADRAGGFYTADEFDIDKLLAMPGEIIEPGRSCVDAAYRNRPTLSLLWNGLAAYCLHYGGTLFFGCGSLHSTDPEKLAVPLSYLYHYHLAPESMRPRAVQSRYVDMNILPREKVDPRKAIAELPPLLKGYLWAGGFVGDGAVIDEQFNTVDVCIVVKTDLVTDRYLKRFAGNE
ncbi:MAG: GNAT family N-acetyltransferase [Alphaproteobacteria bacterium]|nr:GNAT family N-acetyltransferase [Alphaproteobacteria bacterium]